MLQRWKSKFLTNSMPMKLTITRLDEDGRYETMITRDDGVRFSVKGVAHTFAIPHDLAHFLVEKTLQLHHCFWGSIADGAVFPSMSYVAGRKKPKAAERSKALLKANARHLSEAEVLVRIFNDTIEQGHGQTSPVLYGRLKERWAAPGNQPREISQTKIAELYTSYSGTMSKWRNLSVGGHDRPPVAELPYAAITPLPRSDLCKIPFRDTMRRMSARAAHLYQTTMRSHFVVIARIGL